MFRRIGPIRTDSFPGRPRLHPPCGVPSDEPVMQLMKSYRGNDAEFTTALEDYYYSRDDARHGRLAELFAAQRRLHPVLLSPAHLGDAWCAWRGRRNASSVAMVAHPIRKLDPPFNARQAWKAVPLATTVSEGRIGAAMNQDINVLALVKGEERYVFLYDDASRAETLRTLGRYASNPELSFTWYDAAVLSQKIRQESQRYRSNSRFDMPLPTDSEEA